MGDRLASTLLRRGVYLLVVGLLATTVSLLAACGDSGRKTSASRPHVQITQVGRDRWAYARARFNEMCAGCHRLADAHAHGRRFFLDNAGGISTEHARFTIEQGEPGMPAWRGVLSRREIEELVEYVAAVARHGGGETNWLWQIRLRMEGDAWRPPGEKSARG